MKKEDLTIVIKNIPSKELQLVWKDVLQMTLSRFSEITEPSNHITVEFDEICDMQHFYEALGFAMTQHCMTSAVKIKGTA